MFGLLDYSLVGGSTAYNLHGPWPVPTKIIKLQIWCAPMMITLDTESHGGIAGAIPYCNLSDLLGCVLWKSWESKKLILTRKTHQNDNNPGTLYTYIIFKNMHNTYKTNTVTLGICLSFHRTVFQAVFLRRWCRQSSWCQWAFTTLQHFSSGKTYLEPV